MDERLNFTLRYITYFLKINSIAEINWVNQLSDKLLLFLISQIICEN